MSNILTPFESVLVRHEKKKAADTEDTVKIGPVPTGKAWHVTHVSFRDETNDVTDIRVELLGLGEIVVLLEKDAPGSNTLFSSTLDILVPETCSIGFHVTGATADDVLACSLCAVQVDLTPNREG